MLNCAGSLNRDVTADSTAVKDSKHLSLNHFQETPKESQENHPENHYLKITYCERTWQRHRIEKRYKDLALDF